MDELKQQLMELLTAHPRRTTAELMAEGRVKFDGGFGAPVRYSVRHEGEPRNANPFRAEERRRVRERTRQAKLLSRNGALAR